MPVSFSHAIELSMVDDDKDRDRLVEEALARQLSVRQLHRIIADKKPGAGEPSVPDSPDSMLVVPVRKWLEHVVRWEHRLGALKREQLSPSAIALLRESLNQQKAIHQRIARVIQVTAALVLDETVIEEPSGGRAA